MKKIIALLLALIMTFSVATVAFATDSEETTDAPAIELPEDITGSIEEALGEYNWILDLPFGTVAPALKIAKIALKFLKVYLKICDAFNLDPMETAQSIIEYVGKLAEEYAPESGEEETTAAPQLA